MIRSAGTNNLGYSFRQGIQASFDWQAAYDSVTKDVRDFGVAVSEQDAAQIQRTNDALSRIGLLWRGIANQLAVAAAPALEAVADHLRGYGRGDRNASQRRACMIVKTMLGTTSEDGAIAERAREHYDGMRAEFARYFRKAQEAGELPANANPDRLAQRFQANVTALRVEAHRGADLEELADLAESMAIEVERTGVSSGGRTKR